MNKLKQNIEIKNQPDADNRQVNLLVRQKPAVVWFSCGAASAVACKLALDEYVNVEIIYCDTGGEHPDNKRFLKDCEKWFGRKIKILKNEKYKDHFDVFVQEGYIVDPRGAICTRKLKRELRMDYQKLSMIHIFGYTIEERMRAAKFEMRNKGLKTDWILIRNEVSKQNCLGIIWEAGIKLPEMYDLGYNHNNCIGCVKGGMGYWNKIRKDFPEQFNRMAKLEREIKYAMNKEKIGVDENGKNIFKPVYLDELEPDRGNFAEEPDITCDIFCHNIVSRFSA